MKKIIVAVLVSLVSIGAQAEPESNREVLNKLPIINIEDVFSKQLAKVEADLFKEVFAEITIPNINFGEGNWNGWKFERNEIKISQIPLNRASLLFSTGLFFLMSTLYVSKKYNLARQK
jgi:hypothetical protein